jgi:hypothetical protein
VTATSRSRRGFVFGGIRALVRLGVRKAVPVGATLFASVPRPSPRLTEPWRVSIATLVSSHPKVPSLVARRLLRRMDRFASVTIGPTGLGFDDKTIRWSRILEIRAYPAANHIPPTVVVDRESDRLREMLPPIPGRRWIVGKLAGGAMTVLTAFVPHPSPSTQAVSLLPCEIVYRNVFGRRCSLSAGLFAATVLALIPEACDSMLAMTADRGIPVRILPDEASEKRTARSHRVRRVAAQVVTRVRMT